MDCIYQACSCVMMDVPREIGFIFCLDLLQTRSTFKPRVKQTIKHYMLHITLHSLQVSCHQLDWCYPPAILVVISYHVITALRDYASPAISSHRVTVTSNHDTRGWTPGCQHVRWVGRLIWLSAKHF